MTIFNAFKLPILVIISSEDDRYFKERLKEQFRQIGLNSIQFAYAKANIHNLITVSVAGLMSFN